ncbi:hypothetical protein PG990_014134 [Apiospora arundinis]
MAFPHFKLMPEELQVEVWRWALLAESQDRVVLLHDTHIIPTKHLVSPFFATDHISRDEAQKFYDTVLPVREVPLIPIRTGSYPDWYAAARSAGGLFNIGPDYLSTALSHISTLEERGSVYLNPTYDTFIAGLDFRLHYATEVNPTWKDAEGDTIMPDADAYEKVVSRPITEELTKKACLQVQNLVLAERGHHVMDWVPPRLLTYYRVEGSSIYLEPATYTSPQAERIWNRSTFRNCTTFQHMWLFPPLSERGFGYGFGLRRYDYTLTGSSACARALLQHLQKFVISRRCLPVRNWSITKTDNEVQVSEPKCAGDLTEPTIMHLVTSFPPGRR